MIGFRSPSELTKAIDDWAARQEDKPPRSEAIRRLVEQALASRAKKRR
jgi:metal-responsive CopG/Arc/MetJ family transcriptional regulator